MKKSVLKAQIILILSSIMAIHSCTKEEDPVEKPILEKPTVETLAAEDISDTGALLKAKVSKVGSSSLEAIGFVYWNPDKFEIDLNPVFDTTGMLPSEIILGTKGG